MFLPIFTTSIRSEIGLFFRFPQQFHVTPEFKVKLQTQAHTNRDVNYLCTLMLLPQFRTRPKAQSLITKTSSQIVKDLPCPSQSSDTPRDKPQGKPKRRKLLLDRTLCAPTRASSPHPIPGPLWGAWEEFARSAKELRACPQCGPAALRKN